MTIYKKLDCVCGHDWLTHSSYVKNGPCYSKEIEFPLPVCPCTSYDPAGCNPELERIMCPQCRLTNMEKKDTLYYCVACSFTLFERQVLEITG